MTPSCKKLLAVALPLLLASSAANATLIGQWTFEGANALADSTGHFGNLVLVGNASTSNGQLNVNGSGNTASGWARTSGYSGPAIRSKTMVAWVTVESFAAQAGSAMTLDRVSTDVFDGIIYGEHGSNKWDMGSNGGSRNSGAMYYQESTFGNLIQMAYTYEELVSNTVRITGYRNGVNIGSYVAANPIGTWLGSNDTEVLFGLRHTYLSNSSPQGALDALISEARLYDTALTQTEIQGLTMGATQAVPEPESLALMAMGLFLLGYARRGRG